MTNEIPENHFFKYAFPCSHILLESNKITKKEFEDLKNKFLNKKNPDKKSLERIFPAAFRRIKKLAEKLGRHYWDYEVIKQYWEKEHNRLINNDEDGYGKQPESFKDLCKITTAKIIDKKQNLLIVEYNNKKRIVFDNLIKSVNIGDRVKIHYAYAIEKI
ncbi:hypothetical protein GF386_03665 [Candidatus Pacearchaeota archaeon]|nr:hypothetical protein [Candidatus Pacearchaeota archaeon]MBD3283249.1 hypothetical protein [Candidatus Pacearchaeota archaeon]